MLLTILMMVWTYIALYLISAYDTYIAMLEDSRPGLVSLALAYAILSIWGFLGGLTISWTCFTAFRWAAALPIATLFSASIVAAALYIKRKR